MPPTSRTLALVASILASLTSGCRRASEGDDTGAPADLTMIESLAEDAFDSALAADGAALQGQASQIAAVWIEYQPVAEADGVPVESLQSLDTAIAMLSAVADSSDATVVTRGRAANAVSEPMDEAFAVYGPSVPTSVLELDFLGREVMLDGMEVDFLRGAGHVDSIETTWAGLRPEVVSAGGDAVATDFDGCVANLRTAVVVSDGTAMQTAAVVELELVDGVEEVFAGSGDAAD